MLAYLTFVFYLFAEMEAAKQRALIRASITTYKQKEKEGASTSAPKVVGKGAAKQKSYRKDDLRSRKDQALLQVTNSQSNRRLLNPAMKLAKV